MFVRHFPSILFVYFSWHCTTTSVLTQFVKKLNRTVYVERNTGFLNGIFGGCTSGFVKEKYGQKHKDHSRNQPSFLLSLIAGTLNPVAVAAAIVDGLVLALALVVLIARHCRKINGILLQMECCHSKVVM